MELSAKKKLSSLTGIMFLVLEHVVGDLPFLFEGLREDQISAFIGWVELHAFSLRMLSSIF